MTQQQKNLNGLKVAILVANGFEQVEMVEPRKALDQAGAQTHLVSPVGNKVRGWIFNKGELGEWGDEFSVDVPLDRARERDYDALLLPGGVMNPDSLRMEPKAVEFARAFFTSGKPVAVICHGPWTIIETGVLRDRAITSWGSIKTDLQNAGAKWVDREVVSERNLVSSRMPNDIPAFNREMISLFARLRPQR
jgi:deglycase